MRLSLARLLWHKPGSIFASAYTKQKRPDHAVALWRAILSIKRRVPHELDSVAADKMSTREEFKRRPSRDNKNNSPTAASTVRRMTPMHWRQNWHGRLLPARAWPPPRPPAQRRCLPLSPPPPPPAPPPSPDVKQAETHSSSSFQQSEGICSAMIFVSLVLHIECARMSCPGKAGQHDIQKTH